MAVRIFPWGTVGSTPKGVLLGLARGIRFDLIPAVARSVGAHIRSKRIYGGGIVSWRISALPGLALNLWLCMEWEPPYPLTPKSVLEVGSGIFSRGQFASNAPRTPGATPAILNHDEAAELAGALLVVPAKTAQTTTP